MKCVCGDRMRTAVISSIFLATLFFHQGMASENKENEKSILDSKNIQVIYFSKTGNTKQIAEYIHEIVGGEICEIKTKVPYPEDYDETTEQAKKEIEDDINPEIVLDIKNLESSEVIFLGSPCWWGTISSPVRTFLTEHDLSGKIIIPFITHGGSGMGEKTLETIKLLCPKAKVLEGNAFGDPKWVIVPNDRKQEVTDWIKSIK